MDRAHVRQYKEDYEPSRVSHLIVSSISRLYNDIRPEKSSYTYEASDSRAQISLNFFFAPKSHYRFFINFLLRNDFTFSYNELLELVLSSYVTEYIRVMREIESLPIGPLYLVRPSVYYTFLIEDNRADITSIFTIGPNVQYSSTNNISLADFRYSCLSRNVESKSHNNRLFMDTCTVDNASLTLFKRNVRKFGNEILYYPEVGQGYFETMARFKATQKYPEAEAEAEARFKAEAEAEAEARFEADRHEKRRSIIEYNQTRFAKFARDQQGGCRQKQKKKQTRRRAKNRIR